MSAANLAGALSALVAAATEAGLDPNAARNEGLLISAAVAESNREAFVEWCREVGVPRSAETFMNAATKGRRYRVGPTPLASQAANSPNGSGYAAALGEVCQVAATLGVAGPAAVGAAAMAAAAQLPHAAHAFAAPSPALAPSASPAPAGVHPDTDPAQQEFLRQAPGILGEVLSRLSSSQQRLLDAGGLDPSAGGAFPGLGGVAFPEPNLNSSLPGPTGADEAAAPNQPAVAAPAAAEPVAAETEEPEEPEKTVEEWLAELDELIGLDRVKSEIRRQTAILRVDALRTKAGLKNATITRHLIFTGNPGTGKTTVARMVAGIYKAIGLLSKGQLVEVDRSELVAGYLGQTAIKTAEVTDKALGGVLFIDEAYSLNGDQYGEEAINTLVKEMEDNRDDLVVIVAGYPAPMEEFIANNPGLASRFRTTIDFENYTDTELEEIFSLMANKADFDLGEGVLAEFNRQLATQQRDENFGNGRYARNLLEASIGRLAWRLREVAEPTLEQLRTLLPEDLQDETPTTPDESAKAPSLADLTPPPDAEPIDPVEFPSLAETE